MAKERMTDPVGNDQERQEQADQEKVMSIDKLSLEDFQPIPVTAARQPHPFEGYPQKKIKIGTYRDKTGKERDLIVSASSLVALNPKVYVHQDPSGKGISIVSGGKEKIVDYNTLHSRIVRDESGKNIEVLFSREIIFPNGQKITRCAYCPDHTARAQIVYRINKKTGRVEVDDRYVVADGGQVSRLRQLFNMFHAQQTKHERLAQKFEAEPESAAQ